MEILNRDWASVVGTLELLWHFTAEFAPQGDIGKYPYKRIEAACGWTGRPGRLIDALLEARFLERLPREQLANSIPAPRVGEQVATSIVNKHHVLVIRDWHEHADRAVKRRLERSGLDFLSYPIVTGKVTHQKAVMDGQKAVMADPAVSPLPVPEPEPEPEPVTHTPVHSRNSVNGVTPALRAPQLSRFTEWLRPWPRVGDATAAARMWQKTVTTREAELGAFAARDRYLASDEVSRNVIMSPAKFIREQAKAGWTGKWPEPATKEKGFVANVTSVIKKRIEKGQSPW